MIHEKKNRGHRTSKIVNRPLIRSQYIYLLSVVVVWRMLISVNKNSLSKVYTLNYLFVRHEMILVCLWIILYVLEIILFNSVSQLILTFFWAVTLKVWKKKRTSENSHPKHKFDLLRGGNEKENCSNSNQTDLMFASDSPHLKINTLHSVDTMWYFFVETMAS